jgi:hypothetical protein
MFLHNQYHIASAWILVAALVIGPIIGLRAMQALRDVPQQNWERVVNPRHDGALIEHTSSQDAENVQRRLAR